jgi:hypothetical protein
MSQSSDPLKLTRNLIFLEAKSLAATMREKSDAILDAAMSTAPTNIDARDRAVELAQRAHAAIEAATEGLEDALDSLLRDERYNCDSA